MIYLPLNLNMIFQNTNIENKAPTVLQEYVHSIYLTAIYNVKRREKWIFLGLKKLSSSNVVVARFRLTAAFQSFYPTIVDTQLKLLLSIGTPWVQTLNQNQKSPWPAYFVSRKLYIVQMFFSRHWRTIQILSTRFYYKVTVLL